MSLKNSWLLLLLLIILFTGCKNNTTQPENINELEGQWKAKFNYIDRWGPVITEGTASDDSFMTVLKFEKNNYFIDVIQLNGYQTHQYSGKYSVSSDTLKLFQSDTLKYIYIYKIKSDTLDIYAPYTIVSDIYIAYPAKLFFWDFVIENSFTKMRNQID